MITDWNHHLIKMMNPWYCWKLLQNLISGPWVETVLSNSYLQGQGWTFMLEPTWKKSPKSAMAGIRAVTELAYQQISDTVESSWKCYNVDFELGLYDEKLIYVCIVCLLCRDGMATLYLYGIDQNSLVSRRIATSPVKAVLHSILFVAK